MSDLNNARLKINAIDKEMAKLFEERMKVSKEVAEYKMHKRSNEQNLLRHIFSPFV